VENLQNYKAILLDSKSRKNAKVVCKVPLSRYASILRNYYTINGVYIYKEIEDYQIKNTPYFILSVDDGNENRYKIMKNAKMEESEGHCKDCDCSNKRMINGKTGLCYYKEMINDSYLTKIK
jgi:hypothetical protein